VHEQELERDEAPDEMMESVARELRQPVIMDASLDARIMDAIRPVGRRRRRAARVHAAWTWGVRPRQVSLSPLGAIAMAAGIVLMAVVGARASRPTVVTPSAPVAVPRDPLLHQTTRTAQLSDRITQFSLVAPEAERVALVGDFNDWKEGATPLVPVGDGVWSAALTLDPGRYKYMFLVDGRPTADPATPPVPVRDDDFGVPSSVITVGEVP
jgi:hypothetical protein